MILANSEGLDINDSGHVVGGLGVLGGSEAFVWDETNGAATLGVLGGDSSIANATNGLGQIVGNSEFSSLSEQHHAVLWDGGNITDLGTLGNRPPLQDSSAVASRRQMLDMAMLSARADDIDNRLESSATRVRKRGCQ